MATVTGPLHSDAARGQFAKQLIFQRRHGRTVVKKYAAPVEPNTADQLAVQAETKLLAQLWETLTPQQQLTWLELAYDRGYSPANAHFVENWKRYIQGLDPTPVWPPVVETFDPSTYGVATNWLDPSTGLTLSGSGNVTEWADRIGSLTPAQAPDTWAITPAAGPPAAIQFPADNMALLDAAAPVWTADQTRSLVVAYKKSSVNNYAVLAGQFSALTLESFALETWADGGGGDPHLTLIDGDLDSLAPHSTDWKIAIAEYDGTDATLSVNNETPVTAPTALSTAANSFGIGYLEALPSPDAFLIGDVIIYAEPLTAPNRAALLAALYDRYAITP